MKTGLFDLLLTAQVVLTADSRWNVCRKFLSTYRGEIPAIENSVN
jgi:hypothetical protein